MKIKNLGNVCIIISVSIFIIGIFLFTTTMVETNWGGGDVIIFISSILLIVSGGQLFKTGINMRDNCEVEE